MSAEPIEDSIFPEPPIDEETRFEILDSKMNTIIAKLDALTDAHNDVVEKVNDIIENVKPHLDEIGPMLDAIASHPMLRMFVGGPKKEKKKVTP